MLRLISTATLAALVSVPRPRSVPPLPSRHSIIHCTQPVTPDSPSVARGDPGSDWAGLPAAVAASRCGAINHQLVQTADAEAVLRLVKKQKEQFNAVNVATALHRVAVHLKKARAQRDRIILDERFVTLIDKTITKAPEFNPRSVTDVLWACATLQHWPPPMLKPVLTQVAVHLNDATFEPQHLSRVAWALAILECKPVRLLEQIEEQSVRQLSSFTQQNCANVIWAFARLQYQPTLMLPQMTERLLDAGFRSRLKPVEVSDTAFAMATLGGADEQGPLLEALGARADGEALTRFSSRQLVTIIWAFARLNLRPSQLTVWIERLKEMQQQRPLLAQDQRNLEAALQRLGESTDWLPSAFGERARQKSTPDEE